MSPVDKLVIPLLLFVCHRTPSLAPRCLRLILPRATREHTTWPYLVSKAPNKRNGMATHFATVIRRMRSSDVTDGFCCLSRTKVCCMYFWGPFQQLLVSDIMQETYFRCRLTDMHLSESGADDKIPECSKFTGKRHRDILCWFI